MAEQLFQIAAKALIQNEKGEILMVHIPEWSNNPAHWDLPGGRMDPGEDFLQTLNRELIEEIGVGYAGKPEQLTAMVTSITIPVEETRVPLVFIIYKVTLPVDYKIQLDPDSAEDSYKWFSPTRAAEEMKFKFSNDFCDFVRSLSS